MNLGQTRKIHIFILFKSFHAPALFPKTAGSLTVQDKQGTHAQLSLNNTTVDHSGNNTVLRIVNFWTESFF